MKRGVHAASDFSSTISPSMTSVPSFTSCLLEVRWAELPLRLVVLDDLGELAIERRDLVQLGEVHDRRVVDGERERTCRASGLLEIAQKRVRVADLALALIALEVVEHPGVGVAVRAADRHDVLT